MKKNKKAVTYSSSLIKKIINERNPRETNRVKEKMLIAAKIEDLMKEKGWKKSDLARKTNQNPSVITKWLSGTHNFSINTLSDLGFLFGTSFFTLKTKDNKTKRSKQKTLFFSSKKISLKGNHAFDEKKYARQSRR